jgi:hypothetical protein
VKNKASTILINAKGKYKPLRGYMHYVMKDGSREGYCPFGMILKELGYDIPAGVMWHFDTNKELKKLGLEDRHVNHILKMFDNERYTIDQVIDYLKGKGL